MKNSLKISIVILILTSILSGCIGNEKYPQRYTYQNDSKTYLIFNSDKTFITGDERGSMGGSYTIDNDNITLILPPTGTIFGLKKVGSELIDENNNKWILNKTGGL